MIVKEVDLTGKNLGNYKIVGKLGQGGMAMVYKAHELSLNRMVALKVLSSQLSEDKAYIKRFQREAQAAAQLNHPNIVQIYAIGEEQGVHYFAMEYIKGKSLADIRQEEGVLKPGDAVPIIRQVAEALAEAHKVGLVHRDIKPSNIMIDAAGRPKVTDFGIAYVSYANTKLTRDGSIIGTPEYLSPEQCEGKTVDQRSDIYSLGVTLYELLSGKTPYEADTPVSMLMKIVKGEFPPLQEVNPNVPESLRVIVDKMMLKDVQQRYQRMEELIKDLVELEPGKKVPATAVVEEVAARQETAAGSKSNKWAAIIVAAIIVILMGGAFAAKMLYFDKKAARDKEEKVAVSGEISPAATGSQSTESQPTDSQSQETGSMESQGEAVAGQEMPGQETSGSQETMTAEQPSTSEGPETTSFEASAPTTTGSSTTSPPISEASTGTPGTTVTTGTKAVQQSSRTVTPVKPLPPARSCLITAIGDDDKADLVAPYIEEILSRKNFTVMDGPSVSGRKIADTARNHIVVTVKQTGSTSLNYYGNSSEMITARISIKVVNPKTGKIVVGPMSQTVEYTALNSEEKLSDAVDKLMYRFLPALETQSR
ncbi:MAG: serine/threonine-protein kinase [Candidatus Aminicenantes bacterium]|jgi:serine/threonine-protein kinase